MQFEKDNSSSSAPTSQSAGDAAAPASDVTLLLAKSLRLQSLAPAESLFSGLSWKIAPQPLAITSALQQELESMGRVVLQFYKAVNLLYRYSVEGKAPAWVAQWLDIGKPPELVDLQRSEFMRNRMPAVLRPDIILSADATGALRPKIVELDSVPGGIGLTAFFNQAYAALGDKVLGGSTGMLEGFASIFGSASKVQIVVSDEAATYRPEMQWLCQQLNRLEASQRFVLQDQTFATPAAGEAVYRFFELFDLANIPAAQQLFAQANRSKKEAPLLLTPPPRPIFEEKMLAALLWNGNLAEFWRRELGEKFLKRMKDWTPETWLMVPGELPAHAAIPGLGITSWSQLEHFSQRERALVIKVSGFSDLAWGSRSVTVGSDCSQAEWKQAIDTALGSFDKSPYVLQRFYKPALIPSFQFDPATQAVVPFNAKVRICPYFFIQGEQEKARAVLSGALATLCPPDKKIIHGMQDAALSCVSVG